MSESSGCFKTQGTACQPTLTFAFFCLSRSGDRPDICISNTCHQLLLLGLLGQGHTWRTQ